MTSNLQLIIQIVELTTALIQDHVTKASVEGNAVSYEFLYRHHAKAMYNTCLRIVNNIADAEDILQDAFVDAFKNLDKLENRSGFGGWLKRIVIHKSINLVKRKRNNWVELEDDHQYFEADEQLDEAAFEWKIDEIKKMIQKLPDGYRTILCLHLFEDYKQEQISEMLGITHATVRTQYIRAKKKLLAMLKEGGIS